MSGWNAILSLVLTALAVMGSPGPSTVSLTAAASAFGAGRAVPYAAGLVAGTVVVLLAVALGLTAALLSVPHLAPVLAVISVAYVGYLAFRIATAPPLALADAAAVPPGFPGGLTLGVANPKAYIAVAAVFAANHVAATPAADAIGKTLILAVVIIAIHAAWLVAGAAFASVLRDPVRSRLVNVALAVALVVFTLAAFLPHRG